MRASVMCWRTFLAARGPRFSLAADGQEGLALLEEKPFDVLFTSLRMPVMDGLTVLQRALLIRPDLLAVILAEHGRLSSCVEAVRLGACDYVTKPFTPAAIRTSLARALAYRQRRYVCLLPHAAAPLAPVLLADAAELDLFLRAESPAMRAVRVFVAKIAPTDAPVLIRGEPGVGKGLVVQAIHQQSTRASRALVHASCKGIPEAQLEAKLFGGQPQDVEDAKQVRHGLLESAQGGTLFLSDVESLPLWAQVRLFDTLQGGYADRLASSESAPPDVRLIASTSCDLEAAVAEGRFYGGLYYLLNVTAVRVPPLRERRQDIKMLVDHYLRHTLLGRRIDAGKTPWGFTEEAWQCLLNHDWPGNLPELAGVVAHAVALTDGRTIGKDVVACSPHRPEPRGDDAVSVPLTGKLCEIERHVIEEVIQRCGGNKAAAARALGLHRRTLYRMLEEGAGDSTADASREKR